MGVEHDFGDFADAMAAAATGYGGLGEPVPYAGGGAGGDLITDAMRDQQAASAAAQAAVEAQQAQQASGAYDALDVVLNQMFPVNPNVAHSWEGVTPNAGKIDWDLAEKLGLDIPPSLSQAQIDKYGNLPGPPARPTEQAPMWYAPVREGSGVKRAESSPFHSAIPPLGVTSALASAIMQNWDRGRRSTTDPYSGISDPSVLSNLVSDVPAQMPGYVSGDQSPPQYEDNESGNIAAIRRFLQDPNYGNIPQVDPTSSLAAYQNAIGGIDALVGERGFTDRGYAQAARDRAQGIFDKFEAGQDFDSMLNEKIGRAFADEALFNKDIELRGQGVQAVEQAFPQGFASDIFDPDAFSKAADNIYGQKLQDAQGMIARAGSRGQLSPRGGRLASESLLSQGPDVQSRLTDILGGVRSEAEGGLGDIRGSALEAAQGYKLGDELFDVTPFETQASDYLSTTVGELPGRISTAVGTDPLFSATSALQTGGRQQGQVSGTPSFLDVLAEREGGVGTGRDRRGLGSRGSGVF